MQLAFFKVKLNRYSTDERIAIPQYGGIGSKDAAMKTNAGIIKMFFKSFLLLLIL